MLEEADSIIQDGIEFAYGRKSAAAEGLSVVMPPRRFDSPLDAVLLELAIRKHDKKAVKEQFDALMHHFAMNEILNNISYEDYRSLFDAMVLLDVTEGLTGTEEDYTYFCGIVHDFISQLSYMLTPALRNSYYEQARGIIVSANQFYVSHLHSGNAAALYDNALLFKGLRLAVTAPLNLYQGGHGLPRIDEDSPFRLLQKLAFLGYSNWAFNREALERAGINEVLGVNWEKVRNQLTDDEVAVEFIKTGPEVNPVYYASVLKKDYKHPEIIRLCSQQELDNTRSAESIFDYGNLYSAVWRPMADVLRGVSKVYFSPDGELYAFPIEYARMPDGRRVNEAYTIHRLSSTRKILETVPRVSQYNALVYGGLDYDVSADSTAYPAQADHPVQTASARSVEWDRLFRDGMKYLPESRNEAAMIDSCLIWSLNECTLLTGAEGTESSFKALAPDGSFNLIHIASHGFFWSEEEARYRKRLPFLKDYDRKNMEEQALSRAGIAFSGVNKSLKGDAVAIGSDDGILTASELSNMNLSHVDLVVLSACQSGKGYINGEGVFGLQRGFKVAGVRSLLMSLWKVNDRATSMLMSEFYRHLINGETKTSALAAAQRYVRSQPEFRNPRYWAGFILLDALN